MLLGQGCHNTTAFLCLCLRVVAVRSRWRELTCFFLLFSPCGCRAWCTTWP